MLMRIKIPGLLLAFIFFVESVGAVDSNALWLPKKYRDAKTSLMRVAQEAESTERCIVVIAGEMVVNKNTDEHYHFVVTCRDSLQRSYNMSYRVPKMGGVAELLLEQRSTKSAIKQGGVALGKSGLTREKALQQCANSLAEETVLSGWTQVIEDQIVDREHGSQWAYHFGFPFYAKNRFEKKVQFNTSCFVDNDGVSELKLGPLHREQALEDCYEGLADEAILIGWIDLLHSEVSDLPHQQDWAYRFNMPFNSKNRAGELVRNNADCHVNEGRDTEIETRIDIEGIENICLLALKKETKKMMGMKILTNSIEPVTELEYEFELKIPFDATDPTGRQLHYVGECNVDDAGRSTIEVLPRR